MRIAPAVFMAVLSVGLTACGTPQQRCIGTVTRELRTVTALIAETEASIARGYRYERDEVIRYAWERCEPEFLSPGHPLPRRMCWEPYTDTVERPVAIDPDAEERTLANLIARRKTLEMHAAAQIAECKSRFPESA